VEEIERIDRASITLLTVISHLCVLGLGLLLGMWLMGWLDRRDAVPDPLPASHAVQPSPLPAPSRVPMQI